MRHLFTSRLLPALLVGPVPTCTVYWTEDSSALFSTCSRQNNSKQHRAWTLDNRFLSGVANPVLHTDWKIQWNIFFSSQNRFRFRVVFIIVVIFSGKSMWIASVHGHHYLPPSAEHRHIICMCRWTTRCWRKLSAVPGSNVWSVHPYAACEQCFSRPSHETLNVCIETNIRINVLKQKWVNVSRVGDTFQFRLTTKVIKEQRRGGCVEAGFEPVTAKFPCARGSHYTTEAACIVTCLMVCNSLGIKVIQRCCFCFTDTRENIEK